MRIKRLTKHDPFKCQVCEQYQSNLARREYLYSIYEGEDWKEEYENELKSLEKKCQKAENHKIWNKNQREQYKYIKNNLKNDEFILTVDFTNVGEWGADEFIQVLVCHVEYKEGNNTIYKYFDYAGENESNDVWFWIDALDMLFKNDIFKSKSKCFIFSDGSAKHFKQRKTQLFMSFTKILYNITARWCFFCSNHAHNICDSHASVLKRKISSWRISTGNKVPNFSELNQMVNEINQKEMKTNIDLFLMKNIERDSFDCNSLKNIQKFHDFQYPEPGIVFSQELTDFEGKLVCNPSKISYLETV